MLTLILVKNFEGLKMLPSRIKMCTLLHTFAVMHFFPHGLAQVDWLTWGQEGVFSLNSRTPCPQVSL